MNPDLDYRSVVATRSTSQLGHQCGTLYSLYTEISFKLQKAIGLLYTNHKPLIR